mmetsp:Transcript_16865/g.21895  ORF Transcript_16865/g.21895 Transcript_16865/m.21895 type:complete len:200 (-) Transcript_16865:868-1467(-)
MWSVKNTQPHFISESKKGKIGKFFFFCTDDTFAVNVYLLFQSENDFGQLVNKSFQFGSIKLFKDNRHLKCCLFQVFVPITCTEVATIHINLHKHRVGASLHLPQFGCPFAWLPVGNARVIQSTSDKHEGVFFISYIVVGGVFGNVLMVLLLIWISPFFPLRHREGDGRVAHGVHHVHKRYICHCNFEEVWSQVDGGTNQ